MVRAWMGAALVCLVTAGAEAGRMSHGPLVGGIGPDRATLWVRTDRPASVCFLYWREAEPAARRTSGEVVTAAGRDFTAHVTIADLQPSTRYAFTPVVDGRAVFESRQPGFVTAPLPGDPVEFAFVYLSDFEKAGHGTNPGTFDAAADCAPVLTIVGGDFDHRNPGVVDREPLDDVERIRRQTRRMYRENLDEDTPNRRVLVRRLLRRSGVVRLWDDHDYCCNDGDGTFIGKHAALEVLDEYFPGYPRPDPGGGIHHTWTWGQVQFFLLDGRFHRSPADAVDDGAKTMLGVEQKAWLERELAASTAVWKILLSASVFNPTAKCGADSWCDYRTEGRELVTFMRESGIDNVVVISGDLHAGAITDGRNSVYDAFWEMVVPGADVTRPGCDTTTYQGPGRFGEWSLGTWGEGYRTRSPARTCFGFGLVEVLTDPDRLVLSVLDAGGKTVLSATVPDARVAAATSPATDSSRR